MSSYAFPDPTDFASVPAGGRRFSIVYLCFEMNSFACASPEVQVADLSQFALFLSFLHLLENL